jgi:hypothetical protein
MQKEGQQEQGTKAQPQGTRNESSNHGRPRWSPAGICELTRRESQASAASWHHEAGPIEMKYAQLSSSEVLDCVDQLVSQR